MQKNLVCIISFHILFNNIYAQTTRQRYSNCSATFDCGSLTDIPYPFWGSTRPEYCGHPKLQLNCTDETANINLGDLNYRVLEINSSSKSLKVVREDYIEKKICLQPYVNTTLDWEILTYAPDVQNISLYYGCSGPSPIVATSQYNVFSCMEGSAFFTTSQDLRNSTVINYVGSCETKVLVQATQSAIRTLETNQRIALSDLFGALDQGFGLQWDVNNAICNTCLDSGGACGYNTSFTCYCSRAQQQPFTSSSSCAVTTTPNQIQPQPGGGDNDLLRILVSIGATSAIAIIIIASSGCYYCYTRKRGIWSDHKEEKNVEAFIVDYHSQMPQRYSYSDIKKLTNSFTNKLGQGGFGCVYHGNLSDGRPVAVKLLEKSIGDGEEFINEVASISRTSHVNVVTLLGFCYQRTKRALVYEYMPNGSLDKFTSQLEQKQLFQISIGIARGLEYLHRGCNTRIVHFDIKPHNILLDDDMCPKISDFGLAKLCKGKESIVSMPGARGTAGYIAPEVFMRGYGGVSYKSDVYSYGMMILDIFAGKDIVDNKGTETSSSVYFPDPIYKYLERGDSDENMILDEEEETVRRKMIIVGLWCIQTNPTNRPSMTKVIEMLEGSIELLHIPPKPHLFSSTNPADFASSRSIYPQSQLDEEEILPLSEAEFESH